MRWKQELAGAGHTDRTERDQPSVPIMQPYLYLLLWFTGVHSLDKFRGPPFEVTCPRGALSCEASTDCDIDNINDDLPGLLLTNLTTSTILYCKKNTCVPCIRVQLTASLEVENNSSLDEIGSGSEESIEEDYNEGWIEISTSQPDGGITRCAEVKIRFALSRSRPMATVELSCFPAAMSSEIRVKASTNSDVLRSTHKMEDCTLKDFLENIEWCKVPNINITLEKELQMAVVEIPQNYCMMFKHEVMPAFESQNQLDGDKLEMTTVYRNFSDIVPCLCIEVWSATIEDARRSKRCPFSDAEFQGNVWRLSRLAVEYKGNALQWTLSSPCNMSGEIMLCSKSGDGEFCHEIPHSRRNFQVNKLSEFKSVDPHPSLCVKIISGEHVNVSCPFDGDVSSLWIVKSKLNRSNVVMTIDHAINHMNFSICIMEGNKCEHFLQKIKQVNQQKKQIDLISQDCLQIWRSDVKFSPRITVCPFEKYARARWTPLMVLSLIPVIAVIAILMVKKEILKGCTEVIKWDYNTTPTGSPRKILLLYSVDHSRFEKLVGTFASLLDDLNIKVIVDLWKRKEIGIQGTLPWFHSQKAEVVEDGGKIIILFSKGASIKCNAWLNSSGDSETLSDPYDGFMAALNCALPDVTKGNVSGNYVVAYFEDLLNKACIPEIFRKVPIYSLPSQVPEFLQEIGLPAKCVSDQKKHGCPSNISKRLSNVIKECRIWEESHSTGFRELKKFENISKEQHERVALIRLPTKIKNLSIV